MTKQTIEELIPEIREKCGWYFYYHDSKSTEAKEGIPEIGGLIHYYIQSANNYPSGGTHSFEKPVDCGMKYMIKFGRIWVATDETTRKKVDVPKKEIVKVPRNDFWGELGFTEKVTRTKTVKEERDIPVYRTMPYFSDPNFGTAYFKFEMGSSYTRRGPVPGVHLGVIIPSVMRKNNEGLNKDDDLFGKVVDLIRENPFNTEYLLNALNNGMSRVDDIDFIHESYYGETASGAKDVVRYNVEHLKATEEQIKEYKRYLDARKK